MELPSNISKAAYHKKLRYYMESLTMEEIRALVSDPENMGKLNAVDAFTLVAIAAGIKGDAMGSMEREKLLDRLYGKPKQTLVGGDADDAPIRVVHEIDREIVERYLQQRMNELNGATTIIAPAG